MQPLTSCENCGQELKVGEAVCPNCGFYPQPQVDSQRSLAGFLLVGLVVAGILYFSLYGRLRFLGLLPVALVAFCIAYGWIRRQDPAFASGMGFALVLLAMLGLGAIGLFVLMFLFGHGLTF